MKAAVCYEFGKPLVIEDINIADPSANEVKIKVACTAICHSDIHDMKGELPGPVPFVGGHETAGYVEAAGPGVTAFKKGDRVVVSLLASCGECYYCITGTPHLCPAKFAPPKNVRISTADGKPLAQKGSIGGFAEQVLVDQSQLVIIPDDMPMDRAALLACGVITGFGAVVNRTQVKAFQSVVVVGAGGVGINALQGAAYVGAYPIIAVDTLDSKLESAKNFGATHTVNAGDKDAGDKIRQLTSGRGADYVYVTVGSIAAIKQGMSFIGARGTAVLIGLPPVGTELCFSPLEIIPFEKNIIGGFMGATNLKVDIPNLVAMYRSGKLKLDELISGRYPLERINEACEITESGESLRNVIMFE
ncbi:MAG: Zn-dependent alcohol dehydrogenase [Dehalococcoidales bacterium]|nr:Zn-dependent alcohol dehydrogenase [Dehalococcoidales bacterium]